jgi:hypothetical protein
VFRRALPSRNQKPIPASAKVPASQAIDVTLQIAPADSHSEFREGELITLSADYSTGSAGNYFINTADQSFDEPTDNLEAVCISPGSDAPPNDLRRFGGSYGDSVDLLENPQHLNVNVNAWHTLKPGSYRVYVESRRIHLSNDGPPEAIVEPVVVSNPIEIRVVESSSPSQAQELAIAVTTIDAYEGSTRDDAQLKAPATRSATVLRFLNTEAATREMARRYGIGEFDGEFREGLLTTRFRDAAIEEMNAAITDPNRPITDDFLTTLAELEVPPDPHAIDVILGNATEETLQLLRERQEKFAKRLAELKAATLEALPLKTAKPRSGTLLDALQNAHYPLSAAEKQQIVGCLISSWDSLFGISRVDLLNRKWPLLASPDWLPLLRTLVDRQHGEGDANADDEFAERFWSARAATSGSARSVALYRIYELSPDEGRERILKEIAKPGGLIDMGTLGVLPDRELPQFDTNFLANYKTGEHRELEADLIARYASPAILPQLRDDFEKHRSQLDCPTRSSLLRYFLRVKPDFGIAQVTAAVGAMKPGDDCGELLASLGSEVRRPEIEKLAIANLYSSDSVRVQNAANALSAYGSAAAEGALWKRLDDFREERARTNKSSEETDSPDEAEGSDFLDQSSLEPRVVSALLEGNSWYLTADQIRTLEAVVAPNEQRYLESTAEAASEERIRFLGFEWDRARLWWSLGASRGTDMDSLKMKLAQFPPGTRVFVHAGAAEMAAHPSEFRELEDAAHSNGVIINSLSTLDDSED